MNRELTGDEEVSRDYIEKGGGGRWGGQFVGDRMADELNFVNRIKVERGLLSSLRASDERTFREYLNVRWKAWIPMVARGVEWRSSLGQL